MPRLVQPFSLTALSVLATLVGCGGGDDSNPGFTTPNAGTTNQTGSCVILEERTLTLDEFITEPLNMAAEDALAELAGGSNTTNVFEYPDESTINLEIAFAYTDGAITYRERDNEGVLSPGELERCFTAIEIAGTVTFTTGDGAFAETIPVTLLARARRSGKFYVEVAQDMLGGTWTPDQSGIDAAAHPSLGILFEGEITNLGSEGVITGISGEDELPVGSWNPPPTQG